MKCPVCKTECHDNSICPECGFEALAPVFLSKEDGEEWLENIVWPWRRKYWQTLADFEIIDREIIKYHSNDETVIIPYGIEKIGEAAFCDNESIREVYFPDTIKTIGEFAFYASKLEFVSLPSGIESIELRAFSSTDIRSITIPSTCKKIGENAFTSCFQLYSATIMRGVEEIEEQAFAWCSNLKSVMIPDTVTQIGAGAFSSGCDDMHISIDPRNKTYIVKNNTLIDEMHGRIVSGVLSNPIPSDLNISVIGAHAYINSQCDNGLLVIPPNIATIEDFAFSACKMTKVFIPRTVKQIGNTSFFIVKDYAVFTEAKIRPVLWDSEWCDTARISWGQKWTIVSGQPELLLLESNQYRATLVSYSYDEDKDQLKMLLRFSNHSNTTVRFEISELMIDSDECTFTHWGTVPAGKEARCQFEYEDNEFSDGFISGADQISLTISVKDDDDQYVFATGESITLPGFCPKEEGDEECDELPF